MISSINNWILFGKYLLGGVYIFGEVLFPFIRGTKSDLLNKAGGWEHLIYLLYQGRKNKKENTMSFSLADIEKDFEGFLGLLDKLTIIAGKLGSVGQAVAPLTGQNAAKVSAVSSTVSTLAPVAQSVVESAQADIAAKTN